MSTPEASASDTSIAGAAMTAPVACPRHVAGTLSCDVKDELLVYLTATRHVVALNPSARAIWELCDGATSTLEIANVLGARLDLPVAALIDDVSRAVTELRDAGLVEWTGR